MTIISKKLKINNNTGTIFITFRVRYSNGTHDSIEFKRDRRGVVVNHPVSVEVLDVLEPEAIGLINQLAERNYFNAA
jgi:hypothetical protein